MESDWLQIILQEMAKAGVGELVKMGWEKLRQLLEQQAQPDPAGEWIPIGSRIFQGSNLEQVVDDTEEVPPLLEEAALAASRADSTRLNGGHFETRTNCKFHEYWAVGIPYLPSVDLDRLIEGPQAWPSDGDHIFAPRAAILYYSRVADGGRPYQKALGTARRLLR